MNKINSIYINNSNEKNNIKFRKQYNVTYKLSNISFGKNNNKLSYIEDPFSFENLGPMFYATEEDTKALSYAIKNRKPEEIELLVRQDPTLLLLKNEFQQTNNGVNNAYFAFNNILSKYSNISKKEFKILCNNLECKQDKFMPGLFGVSQIMQKLMNGIALYKLPNNTSMSHENLRKDHELIVETFAPAVADLHFGYHEKLDAIKKIVPSISSTIDKHKSLENKSYDLIYNKVDNNYKYLNQMDNDLCSYYEKLLLKKIPGNAFLGTLRRFLLS